MLWQTSRHTVDLTRPRVMGIVNVTPDSFSDGGRHLRSDAAIAHCERLIRDGADLLDIGGESSRPGALPLSLEEESARVLPVLQEAVKLGVPVAVDTYKPELMRLALDLGADIINDIWALRQPGALEAVSAHPDCGICLMHMHREPTTMQLAPMAGDAVEQVARFLSERALALEALGVSRARIVVDPGIGFGKTVQQNFALLAHQERLLATGYPVLVGWSRKSSLATVTSRSLSELATMEPSLRLVPSVSAALLAAARGARVLRVHDVRETVQALAVLAAVESAEQ